MLKHGLLLSGRAARGCRRGIIAGNATSLQQHLSPLSVYNGKFRMAFTCSTLGSRSISNGFSTLSTVTGFTGAKTFEAALENNSDDGGFLERSIRKLEKYLSAKQDVLEKEEITILEELNDLFSEVLDNRIVDGVTSYVQPVFTLIEESEKKIHGKDRVSGIADMLQHVEEGVQITLKEFAADFALIGCKDDVSYSKEVRLRAQAAVRLAFLKAYCIGLKKSHLSGELRDGTTRSNVMEAVKTMLTEGPKERFLRQFSLFDRGGNGWLTYSEIELAFNASTDPVQAALRELHPQILALPKGAPRTAADQPLRYAYWDTLQLPSRCRCAYTWTTNKKQTGPDQYRVSFDAFWEMVEKYFTEDIGRIGNKLCGELLSQRRGWHDRRKKNKRTVVYGSTLYAFVVVFDILCGII